MVHLFIVYGYQGAEEDADQCSQQLGGLSRLSPAVAMDGERDVCGAGSARRRRERRLRCMFRHERQTVAMALAEQLYRSANRVERDAASRQQMTRAREGEVREEHHALRDRRDLSRGCGRLPFRSRDRRRGSSGTRGVATSWFSTPSCRRWRNSWWSFLHPRLQCLLHRQQWSILPPRPQCSKLPRQQWSILHLRQQCIRLPRWWWSILHLRQQLFIHLRLW